MKPTTVPSLSWSWQPSLPPLGDIGWFTLLIEQEALCPGASVPLGEQERVTPVQPLKPSQNKYTVPPKFTVAPLAPLMLRMVKEILHARAPVPPTYTAFVISTIGVWMAVLVDMKRNQATSEAAVTAAIVTKTVTIGGIPPSLLPLLIPATFTA